MIQSNDIRFCGKVLTKTSTWNFEQDLKIFMKEVKVRALKVKRDDLVVCNFVIKTRKKKMEGASSRVVNRNSG